MRTHREQADPESFRRRLLARIERRYRIVEETWTVGPTPVRLVRVLDPDTVLDEACRIEEKRAKNGGLGKPPGIPYWAVVWDAASAIASFVGDGSLESRIGRPLAGINAMELGCGTGHAGAALLAFGARVMFVDIEKPALLFARLNSYDFGDHARVRQMDWCVDRLDEKFDLILGSDVLYEVDHWRPLERFWRHHLADGGVVVLGEPGRPKASDFPRFVEENGWTLERHERVVLGRPMPMNVLLLRRVNPNAAIKSAAG